MLLLLLFCFSEDDIGIGDGEERDDRYERGGCDICGFFGQKRTRGEQYTADKP